MNKHSLKEKAVHGTPAFPIEIYDNHFDGQNDILAQIHFHREFEFLVVTEGQMKFQIDTKMVSCKCGEGVFIAPEILHSISCSTNMPCSFIAIVFSPEFFCSRNDIIYNKYIEPLINGSIFTSDAINNEEFSIIRNIAKKYALKEDGYEFEIKYNILKLMKIHLSTAQTLTAPIPDRKRELVKQCLEYVHNNYMNPITLKELSSFVYVSPEYLCRVFSELSDSSPIEYLNRYRISQAADMLLSKNKTISEISALCGFNSSSYFNKLFMRYIGTTPRAYRKSNSPQNTIGIQRKIFIGTIQDT